MKRFFGAIRRFFLPPADAKTFRRVLPLIVVAFIMILLFTLGNYAWEESNSPAFCGLTCHTMPPEYVTYQKSPHTNVTCEDCHMGRDRLAVMIQRKVKYSWQTGTAMLLNTYEYPIVAKNMAPAREACENCHKPEKFSTDQLVEIKNYADDEANTLKSTFLVVKTGGGAQREGLGYGIHWHIENPVYFYTTDLEQQDIPYIVATGPNGEEIEYVDVEAGFDPATVKKEQLKKMDCITCHNRTAHLVESPNNTVDRLLQRNLVSVKIPEIKKKAVEVLGAEYASNQAAMDGIAALATYYQGKQADPGEVEAAIKALQEAYQTTNFIDQKVNWKTHPDNLAHQESPGCFRCHDGKHLAASGAAPVANEGKRLSGTIRLECNLCHSIPVVSAPNQITASMQLSKGFEPESHLNPNWIALHREVFDTSCEGCHTVGDPGGVSNTSFCSNSACHGANWEFAGFDAPKLREALSEQVQALNPTPAPEAGAPDQLSAPGGATFATVEAILTEKCGACHGDSAMKGLNLLSYESIMKGGESGAVIIPGDANNSLLVKIQSGAQPHFGQLSEEELALVKEWIQSGATEQ
jgi:mono/diheme cytochrome c family protein